MNRARKLLTAALAAAVVLAGVSLASAAGLPLDGGMLSAAAATHPCPGTAKAVPSNPQGGNDYRAVVMALPPGCGNRFVQLTVVRSGTDRTGITGTTDANGRVTITLDGNYNYTAANNVFLATVSGWDLPTVMPPPFSCRITTIPSTATCTAAVTLDTRQGTDIDFYHVVVRTPSASWVSWEVTFNLEHPFYGSVPTQLGNGDRDWYTDGGDVDWDYRTANVNDVQRSSPCAALPGELRVTGINSGTSPNVFNQVRNNRNRTFDLLLNVTTPSGYDDVISPGCT